MVFEKNLDAKFIFCTRNGHNFDKFKIYNINYRREDFINNCMLVNQKK